MLLDYVYQENFLLKTIFPLVRKLNVPGMQDKIIK